MTDSNTASYTMTGKELEALCQASGRTLKDFAVRVGIPGKQIRSPRASKKVECGDDPFARAAVDQMRTEAKARTAEVLPDEAADDRASEPSTIFGAG